MSSEELTLFRQFFLRLRLASPLPKTSSPSLRRERIKVRVVNFRLTLTPTLSHKWERERLAGRLRFIVGSGLSFPRLTSHCLTFVGLELPEIGGYDFALRRF